jgi:hypothetical protein
VLDKLQEGGLGLVVLTFVACPFLPFPPLTSPLSTPSILPSPSYNPPDGLGPAALVCVRLRLSDEE